MAVDRRRARRQRRGRRAAGVGVLRARVLLRVVLLPRHRRHALDHAAARRAGAAVGRARAREHLGLVRVGRRARPSPAMLIGTIGLTSTYAFDLATFVAGIASIFALPKIAPVAERGPAEPALDRRRLPVRAPTAGRARLHARGRQRDDLRDADGAVPGDRDAQVRRSAPRRLPLRRAVRGRARVVARSRAGSRTCGGRGSRSRSRRRCGGSRSPRSASRTRSGSGSCCSRSRAPPTTSAPSSARRSC